MTKFANKIVNRGLSVPAILFLDMSKYLSFVSSQLMVFFGPILTTFIRSDGYYQLADLLQERDNIEFLLTEIERIESEESEQV